jgi:hypothetical protein
MYRLLRSLILLLLFSGLAGVSADAAGNCGTHYVQRGENLFRISLRYGVNMYAVAAANGIADVTRIYAGQVLVIPCGGTAPQPPPPTYPSYPTYPTYPSYPQYPPNHAPQYPVYPSYLDCRGFRATSPGSFPNGSINFYWDLPFSAQRIARYQVRIFNAVGREVRRYETLSPAYSLQGDVGLGAIGPGVNFSYFVQGVTADQQLCRTPTLHVQREWNGTADPIQ